MNVDPDLPTAARVAAAVLDALRGGLHDLLTGRHNLIDGYAVAALVLAAALVAAFVGWAIGTPDPDPERPTP